MPTILPIIPPGPASAVSPIPSPAHLWTAMRCARQVIYAVAVLAMALPALAQDSAREEIENRLKNVRVSLDTDGPYALLTIADTGLGIPVESQPQIFERFYRVDKARSREEGGSGLGLAICKTIVEAHGGTITFHSEVGQGTTFVVRLPPAENPNDEIRMTSQTRSPSVEDPPWRDE